MIKGIMQGYIRTMFVLGFIYGYFKRGFEIGLGIDTMLSKNNVRHAYGVIKENYKLLFTEVL